MYLSPFFIWLTKNGKTASQEQTCGLPPEMLTRAPLTIDLTSANQRSSLWPIAQS